MTGLRALETSANTVEGQEMSGPAGAARVGAPGRPSVATHRSWSRSRLVESLEREPFVLVVLALDALIVSVLLPYLVRSDTWLALVGGRRVWEHGLPHHDTLTVWSHGVSWV